MNKLTKVSCLSKFRDMLDVMCWIRQFDYVGSPSLVDSFEVLYVNGWRVSLGSV